MTIDWDTHKSKIKNALDNFLANDKGLLERGVNERSISFKIGEYLSEEYEGERNVDCEYNRKGDEVKRLPRAQQTRSDDAQGKTIFPDIIVHNRGNDDSNELIIEIKKEGNNDIARDIEKLESLTQLQGSYKYKFGLHITFSNENISNIDVYEDGERKTEKTDDLKGFLGVS